MYAILYLLYRQQTRKKEAVFLVFVRFVRWSRVLREIGDNSEKKWLKIIIIVTGKTLDLESLHRNLYFQLTAELQIYFLPRPLQIIYSKQYGIQYCSYK